METFEDIDPRKGTETLTWLPFFLRISFEDIDPRKGTETVFPCRIDNRFVFEDIDPRKGTETETLHLLGVLFDLKI